MIRQTLTSPEIHLTRNQELVTYSLIALWFAVVVLLEYATPPTYIFGYLYIGAVLLASLRLNRPRTVPVTLVAVALTILNLWVPGRESLNPPTIATRMIAVLALVVTGFLSNRSRQHYEQIILHQKEMLRIQARLADMREDFVYTLTRDLKTPLLGAVETIKYLERGEFGDILPAQRQVLDVMVQSHITAVRLLQTMLDVYQNDAEGLRLSLAPVDLVSLVRQVIIDLGTLATSRQVEIQVEVKDDLAFVWASADAPQLERVLMNVVANAINYARRAGKVEIVLEAEPTQSTVKIIDDGMAIPEQELPDVFKRFYQGETDRHGMGLGLGLYLSRQIVAAHGGVIWAENRSPHGVLFGFRVPACPAPG